MNQVKVADLLRMVKFFIWPQLPSQRSDAAMKKVASLMLEDGTPAPSFHSLMQDLSTITRNSCRTRSGVKNAPAFQITTTPTAKQKSALLGEELQFKKPANSTRFVVPHLNRKQTAKSHVHDWIEMRVGPLRCWCNC